MGEVVSAITPFFGIVLLGWFAGLRGIVSKEGLAGVNGFIFKIALPPLLFQVMASAPQEAWSLQGDAWRFLTLWGAATLGLYLIALLLSGLSFGLPPGERTLFAHLSANGNVGFLGIPLVVAALGPEAAVPTALALTFDIVIVMSLTTLLLERADASAGPLRALGAAFLNPILLGAVGGAVWGGAISPALGVPLPGPVSQMLDILGQAAPPAALFAVGATLAHTTSDNRVREIGGLAALKLVIHPVAIAALFLTAAPDLPAIWIAAAVLAACCPSSNNAVIFANVYGRYAARASATVLISTALSILTFSAAAAMLAAEGLI